MTPLPFADNVFENVLTGCATGPRWRRIRTSSRCLCRDHRQHLQLQSSRLQHPVSAVWLDPGVDAATIAITGNNFLDGGANSTPGPAILNDSETGTVNAENNWWGSYAGAGASDGFRMGAKVGGSDPVDASPWTLGRYGIDTDHDGPDG